MKDEPEGTHFSQRAHALPFHGRMFTPSKDLTRVSRLLDVPSLTRYLDRYALQRCRTIVVEMHRRTLYLLAPGRTPAKTFSRLVTHFSLLYPLQTRKGAPKGDRRPQDFAR